MRSILRSFLFRLFIPAFLFACSFQVSAFELSVDFFTDFEYSNNPRLINKNERDDFNQSYGVHMLAVRRLSDMELEADLTIDQQHYYKDSFGDVTSISSGFGLLSYELIDEFLSFDSVVSREETITSSLDNDTPDKREYRDLYRVGPSIEYLVSRSSMLKLKSDYVYVENGDPDVSDQKRVETLVSIDYRLNTRSSFFLSSSYDDVIDADEGLAYSDAKFSLGLTHSFVRGLLQMQVGRGRVSPENQSSFFSDYFNILFRKDEMLRHGVSISYNQSLSDTSLGLGHGFDLHAEENNESLESAIDSLDAGSQILIRRRFDLAVDRVLGTNSYDLLAFSEDKDYKGAYRDERAIGFSGRVRQLVLPDLVVALNYDYTAVDFVDRDDLGKDETHSYSVDVNYDVTADLNVTGNVGFARKSNNVSSSREYEAFTIGLGATWSAF